MSKYLIVTGGLGFIGSNLVDYLINKNFRVINIDKVSYSSNFYNVRKCEKNKNYLFVKCNLNNFKKFKKIIWKYKPLCIFNLAAETHVDRSIDNPSNFINSNILGTFNLLEIFKEFYKKNKNTKLIHISTDEVFGDKIKGRSKENDTYFPSSPYAASKASSDHLVKSYVRTFKIPAIVTNCSNNYGPRQHPEKLIPKLIYNIINDLPLPIYGKGENSREWIYVGDHCDALFKIFKKGKNGETYNIGSGSNLNNIEIVKSLINIAKKYYKVGKNTKIKFVKDRPGHDLRYALDSNKLIKKLNWNNKISFDEGLKKTFLWYLENQDYFKKLNKKDIINRLGHD